ncbi:MAG: retroviral-like aspartic protease family protein [Hyphomonadaceae bacterium]|nr:retroviral-like aspartic protease family protein [Hyphomonadaceae bacterium]
MRRTLLKVSLATVAAALFPEARAQGSAELADAWSAWANGDFARARILASEAPHGGDEARHIQVLAAAAQGDHAGAMAIYAGVSSGYRRFAEMDEAVFWAYVWSGDISGAQSYARRRRSLRGPATRGRLRTAEVHPNIVEVSGAIELPFTGGFSQYMPGVAARVNGLATVARIDTGGSFIHMSRSQARDFGVPFSGCEREFAALITAPVCHGRADLELGGARLRNAPVAVHPDNAFASPVAIAAELGGEFGVVIGTNVFRQFLTTVDAPSGRLLLSARTDAHARADHLARLPDVIGEIPFGILSDHLIIARGCIGAGSEVPLFIDSGLAAFTTEQGQAALLASQSTLRRWGATAPADGRFAELPVSVRLGPVEASGLTAFEVSDTVWRNGFGDWNGVNVEALISHGFLKHWAWTLDFDRQRLLFHARGVHESEP